MAPRSFSTSSNATDAVQLADELCRGVNVDGGFCLFACTVDVSLRAALAELQRRCPKTIFVATTSCQHVASDKAVGGAAALFVDGAGFRAGAASGADPSSEVLGERLARLALRRANMAPAEARFVVVHATPGLEEGVLVGLGKVIGDACVVIGGTGADNDLTGHWMIAGPDGALKAGASLLICDWPWKIGVSYQGGYLATEHEGVVTAADGRRLISIDNTPAVEVYERWMNKTLPRGVSVLPDTTLTPLGVAHGAGGGLDVHVLVHPERVNADGSINCFATTTTGDRILMMEASLSSLVRRGGLVNRFALQQAGLTSADIVAGFVIYCAGCSLALGPQVEPMTQQLRAALPNVPFLMPFTFGEQGRLRRGRIDHGNLMLSTLLLSNKPVG